MNILGISCFYHDASACLLRDGKIIAAAEQERFSRVKHDVRFPKEAVEFCLKQGGISIGDVDFIVFYEKPLVKFERVLYQHLEMFPRSFWAFFSTIPSWLNEKLRVPSIVRKKLGYTGDVLFVEHHLAHAASAYLSSPFKEAAILTVDGVGEWATTTYGVGKGSDITLLKEIRFPHSFGLLYSTVTAHLGFKVNNDEYKVMGLASYGEPTYYDEFKRVIHQKGDGGYCLDMSYLVYHYKLTMPGKKFIKEFGPIRKKDEGIVKRHMDIAASLQKITEETILNMLDHLHKETQMKNVCMAGGVALNGVANGKILRNTSFEDIYIQPAASDAGTSIGAALYIYNSVLGKPRGYIMDSAYLGPEFSYREIKGFLDSKRIRYNEFSDDEELIKETAKLIFGDKVVGWFQGRMEWGPRALGNRSILANPCSPEMRDIMNKKVKHREEFRPFAPVICIENTREYFDCDNPVPLPTDFMLMVYPIKREKQELIPAVTHVDGSGRLQTIKREQNPLYYDLIKEFGGLSGVPVLVNTSFNIRGEPIVCTPYHAYRCMMGTGIDYLVMDRFIIKRGDNPQDMWESEKYAKD